MALHTKLLPAALKVAGHHGYNHMTRAQIAQAAGVSEALVTYHLGAMPRLRRAVMREAVRVEHLPVIAQGLALRDRHALKASDALRQKALDYLVKK